MKSWDIFCRVIDNYGDIGVCWRLARQLANEHNQQVRLWVDDLNALIRIWPEAQLTNRQHCAGVEVHHWPEEFPAAITADIVIEAFACDIPHSYLQSMAEKKRAGHAPIWINLEYLSAEKWIEDCHGMTSVHPSTGLRKTFFFPGFTTKTGGLLREQNLLINRDSFDKRLFLNEIGIDYRDTDLLISLFAYENPAIAPLLSCWANSTKPIHCLVPAGKVLTSINQAFEINLEAGQRWSQGNLTVEIIPFLTQPQYDLLLWSCDINFVRGEDSFVRAQWAGRPFVWHIYPQEENAHLVKLNAFLDLLLASNSSEITPKLRELWLSWNEPADIGQNWNQVMEQFTEWQTLSHKWCRQLTHQPHLAWQLIALANQ